MRALNSLMGFIREIGGWLHSRLRAGNAYTSDGAESFIRECYEIYGDDMQFVVIGASVVLSYLQDARGEETIEEIFTEGFTHVPQFSEEGTCE